MPRLSGWRCRHTHTKAPLRGCRGTPERTFLNKSGKQLRLLEAWSLETKTLREIASRLLCKPLALCVKSCLPLEFGIHRHQCCPFRKDRLLACLSGQCHRMIRLELSRPVTSPGFGPRVIVQEQLTMHSPHDGTPGFQCAYCYSS